MFRIITNVVYNCSTSAAAERRKWNVPWSGSCVDESETSALPHADLQRAVFHAGQEKKGISNEVMQLVNTKKKKNTEKKSEGFNTLINQQGEFCPFAYVLCLAKCSSG